MQSGIADLTSCFNEDLICKAVTERAEKSKISMEAGGIFFDGFNGIDEKMFEYSANHDDTPKGITVEQLRKVWRVSNEVAQKTLDVTKKLNKQDTDSTPSRHFSTNDRMLRYKILESLFYTDTFYSKQFVSKQGF